MNLPLFGGGLTAPSTAMSGASTGGDFVLTGGGRGLGAGQQAWVMWLALAIVAVAIAWIWSQRK